jgi:hypothetical protein
VKTRYKIIQSKASPFGGLYVLSEFMNQVKFKQMFDTVFGHYRRVRNYHPSENVAVQIASIIAGGERLYDTQRFVNDHVIPDLFSHGSIAEDTTLRDDLVHLGGKDDQRQELLFRLNEYHFHRLGLRSITIDMDGTALAVDGHQEGAELGYCPPEPGSRCFQSLSAICDETETTLAEETHFGNTHCSNGIISFCQRLLDRFSPQMDTIHIRLDAGFYSDDLFKLFESYGNVYYTVSVPQHEWLQKKVQNMSYKSYHESEHEYASFSYNEGLDNHARYYHVQRSKKQPGSQFDLFQTGIYDYRVIITNQGNHQPHNAFKHYNGRGRDEKHLEELKNEYALGKMVSGDFIVTKALFWISYLTFTLIGMLRKVAFRLEMAKYRLRRLRYILFINIACFVEHARTRTLNIVEPIIGAGRFKFLLQRIWAY